MSSRDRGGSQLDGQGRADSARRNLKASSYGPQSSLYRTPPRARSTGNGTLRDFQDAHSQFEYTDPAIRDYELFFDFSGDDDVWVFINDQLVVDLGGVHPEKWGMVNVDSRADELGLETGQNYDFDFFFAERHTVESNFTIETTIQFLPNQYD